LARSTVRQLMPRRSASSCNAFTVNDFGLHGVGEATRVDVGLFCTVVVRRRIEGNATRWCRFDLA